METTLLVMETANLIRNIIGAVDTARPVLSTIDGVLATLPQDPEVVPLLNELGKTLGDAHASWSAADLLFRARCQADSFRQVNARINSHLSIFPLLVYSVIVRRLGGGADGIGIHPPPPDHTGVPAITTVPSPVSSPQTHKVVVVPEPDCPRMFTWDEIAAATNNFAVELGARGGMEMWRLYKGRLLLRPRDSPEVEVAVKVLVKHGELETLVSLRRHAHDHIVGLVGWCPDHKDRMFVYEHEHMVNGTLRDHLLHVGLRERVRVRLAGGYSSTPARVCWRTRVEVLLGASRV